MITNLRRYWGRPDATCMTCLTRWNAAERNTGPKAQDAFRANDKCTDCAGTQRCPIPLAELFPTYRHDLGKW